MRKGITNSGQTMLARSLNGETLSFTGIKIGTGILPESTDLLGLTALINPCLSILTIKVYRPSDRNPGLASNQIVIQAQYNNQTFTEAKAITEYGIYAKIGEEEEKLYAYINASELPDNIAAYSSETYVTKVRDFTLTVGNGTTVQVKVDLSSVYPTMKDFEEGLALKIDKESISTDNTFVTTSDTQVPSTKAVKEYATEKINELINNSPEALNTLKELAAALGDDANFATTVTNLINKKLDIEKSITGLKTTRANNIFFLDSSTLAGALKIPLPQRKTNCFYSFDIEILNTINNKNVKLQINGFNRGEGCNYDDATYTASSYHKAFLLAGEYVPSIAFYTGANEDYILLGGVSDSFVNCRVIINNIKISNQNEDWSTFTIGLLTALESTLNSTQYLIKNIINTNTETINFTSASGTGSNGVVIKSGLPVGTKKLIRKINSTQGTVEISCAGETFTPSALSLITLNADGDFWLIEKVSSTRWDLLDGRETGTNASGSYTVNANGTQEVTGSNALTAQSLAVNMAKNMGTVIDFSVTHKSSSGNYPPTSWYVVGQPSGSIVNLQYNAVPSSTIVAVIKVRGRWY